MSRAAPSPQKETAALGRSGRSGGVAHAQATEADSTTLALVNGALRDRSGTRARGDELTIRCLEPGHTDESPSAGWSTTKGAGKCHGCGATWSTIEAARLLGIDRPAPRAVPSIARRIIGRRRWDIRDASGKLVAIHHRHDFNDGTKECPWSRPNGSAGLGPIRPADLPLYGSHLLKPREPGDDAPVFVCEGEKATDALLAAGKQAVGTVTGASGTPSAEVLGILAGRRVVLWPDADDAGREHMERIAGALVGIASEVLIFEPEGLPPKGDAVEWLSRHDVSELVDIVEALEPLQPTPEPASTSTWAPVDLAAILSGTAPEERPDVLQVEGAALLYRGAVNSLAGEPESMKSWVALEACRQELEDGRTVVYLDFEDSPRSVVSRLRALGIPDADIVARFVYVHPGERCTLEALSALVKLEPGLVVLDGVTESMSLEGLELTDNSDVADYYQRLPRVFARAGACVLLLDHVTKSSEERGRWAIGAQGKLAGISGAAYRIAVVEPFGRGRTGKSKLYLAKDRRGWVETSGSDRLACIVEATSENEQVSITLQSPSAESEFRPTCLMQRVSEALEMVPEGLTGRGVEKAVTGKAGAVRLAVRVLVTEGWITESPGPRGAKLYRSSKPYREHSDPLLKAGTQSTPKLPFGGPPSHMATASH